jgi:hypothetical protein
MDMGAGTRRGAAGDSTTLACRRMNSLPQTASPTETFTAGRDRVTGILNRLGDSGISLPDSTAAKSGCLVAGGVRHFLSCRVMAAVWKLLLMVRQIHLPYLVRRPCSQ